MNVSTWASSPAWTAAGWTMLHFLWVGAAVAAVAAIGRRALRKAHPDVRHAYALATLAALAVAPAAIAWTIAEAPRTAVATPKEPTATIVLPTTFARKPPASRRVETHFEPPHEASPHSNVITYLNVAARMLPGVWLVGAPWTFAYLVAGLLGAERLRRRSRVVGDPGLSAVSARLAGSLGIARRVTVGVCDRIAGPMLLGIARPLILLPASALSGWSPEQVEMALLHELAHVRRWDNLMSLLQRVVESALFFHPAVWIVSGWVRLEREHCCDRIVVDHTGRALDYAGALFVLADAPAPPRVHGAFMVRNHLVDRIRRILNPEEPAMRLSRSAVALAASTLAVPMILLAAYAQHASPQSAEGKAKPPVPEFRRPKGSSASEYMKKVAATGPWEPGPIPESISANVSGVARDEQGEPVAGASLTLYTAADEGKSMSMRSVATAASDAAGRYEFRDARLTVRNSFNGHPLPKEQTPHAPFFILGRAAGMGIAWSKQPSIYAVKNPHPDDIQGRLPLGEPAALDLTFAKAAVLKGKVVDERGEPVAGAKVGVGNAISLDAEGRETGNHQGYDWRIAPDGVGRTTTGANGGFRLEGLSERFCYYVSVIRPESPNTVLGLRAATIDGPDATHDEPPMGPGSPPRSHQARTNPITITFPTPRPIDVSVVGDDDGKPVAGAGAGVLLSVPLGSTGFGSIGATDAAGKVRLSLPPGRYAVADSSPPKDSRYLRTSRGPLVVEAGDAPLSLEIRQKVGAELIIEAVEAGTGKPVADVFFWRTVDDQPDQKTEPGDDLGMALGQTWTNEKGELRGLFTPRPGRRLRFFFFGGMHAPNKDWFAPGAPAKNGYEATPAQSEPVELVPGKPIHLRFELAKAKPAAAENRLPKQEDQPLAIADARLSAQVEAKIGDLFRSDPVVASLIQDIVATEDELDHTKSVAHREQDPARKAAEKRVGALKAKYNDLWNERYGEIRQRFLSDVDTGLPEQVEARINDLFERDPAVAALIQDIAATDEEIEHIKGVILTTRDPALKAAEKRKDQLKAKYDELWKGRYGKIRKHLLARATDRQPEKVEDRISDRFRHDPVVADLIQDILATEDELDHTKSMARPGQDPARKASQKRLGALKAKYNDLWNERYGEIRRSMLAEQVKHFAHEPDPISAKLLAAYFQQPNRPAPEVSPKPAAEGPPTSRSLPRAFTKAAPSKPVDEPRAEGPISRTMLVQVSGVARDDRGGTIADASVTLYAVDFDPRPAATTTTDADGRYEFRDVPLPVMTSYADDRMPPGPPHAWCLVSGRAPGMGVAWGREWSRCTFDPALRRYRAVSPAKLDLTFARAAVVRGKVVDDRGEPIAGATVRVVNYAAIGAVGQEKGDFLGFEWNVLPDGLGRSQTGADGGFQIEGLSERSCYSLAVTRPESPRTEFGLYAATVDGPDQDHGSNGMISYGSVISSGHLARTNPITITLPKLRPIEVSVIGGDDGKPVAGARVRTSGGTSTLQYAATGDTDAAGKLRVNLPPGEHGFSSNPPEGSRYLPTHEGSVIVKPGEPTMPLEIRQKVGAELIFEAVEAGTGEPMPGVSFMWEPEDHAIQQPQSIYSLRIVGFGQTNEKGQFHVAVDPEPGRRYLFRFHGLAGPDLTSFTLEDAKSPPALTEAVRKKGYEAVPAQSDPVELVPGKPIRLRFELRKRKGY